MEVRLVSDGALCLWVGPGEQVQVPMCKKERAECRKALLDALSLLDDTIVTYDTFATPPRLPFTVLDDAPAFDGVIGVLDFGSMEQSE